MSLHLSIYFKTSVLRFTSYSSYKHFVRFIPRYFIFWSYYKWCCVLNFSIQLFIAPKWKYDWCFSFGFVACDLANSLIRSRSIFCRLPWDFLHIVCETVLFFPSNLYSFYSFSCFIPLVKRSTMMLNWCGESEYPCHVSDLRGNTFSILSVSMMLAVGLFVLRVPFSVDWERTHLFLICGDFLSGIEVEFIKCFFYINWDDHVIKKIFLGYWYGGYISSFLM